RRGGAAPAPDATHRRHHPPVIRLSVPRRMAERRARRRARRAAAPPRLLKPFPATLLKAPRALRCAALAEAYTGWPAINQPTATKETCHGQEAPHRAHRP